MLLILPASMPARQIFFKDCTLQNCLCWFEITGFICIVPMDEMKVLLYPIFIYF